MKAFHMVGEHNRVLDKDRSTIRFILSLGFSCSNNNNSKGNVEQIIRVRKGLHPLKIGCLISCQITKHEKNFSDLENFQANTTVFQANTNASLKNLEMQIGQLAQAMQKELKYCMAVTLRSDRELDERRIEMKNTDEEKQAEIGEAYEQNSSVATEKEKSAELHPKQQGRKE